MDGAKGLMYNAWTSIYNPANFNRWHTRYKNEYKKRELSADSALKDIFPEKRPLIVALRDEFRGLKSALSSAPSPIPYYFNASDDFAFVCYAIVRLALPETVVETGVGNGLSSFYILNALMNNGSGRLYSIDAPHASGAENYSGGFVPDNLKDVWTFIQGLGYYEIKRLKKDIPAVDIFIHDSNHTYFNQKAEFSSVIGWVKPGGLIIADDIHNDSLMEIKNKSGGDIYIIKQPKPHSIGILAKF